MWAKESDIEEEKPEGKRRGEPENSTITISKKTAKPKRSHAAEVVKMSSQRGVETFCINRLTPRGCSKGGEKVGKKLNERHQPWYESLIHGSRLGRGTERRHSASKSACSKRTFRRGKGKLTATSLPRVTTNR